MKRLGLKTDGNWYKGNLHLHSTNSDGRKSPTETAKVYADHGYQFVSFTEHEYYTDNQELNRENFLILPGVEFSCEKTEPLRIYHLLGIGQHGAGEEATRENGFCHQQHFPVKKWEGLASVQSIIDEALAANNLVIFNHPNWSRMELSDFVDLEGFCAMEIYNYSGDVDSRTGLSIDYWDSLLRRGRKVWGVATDDAHFGQDDYCGGWVMVNAGELTIEAITVALKEGNFYSSSGPEIYEFYVEDGLAKIACSEVREIHFITYETFGHSIVARGDETFCRGEMKLCGEEKYVRAEVVDHKGRVAWSNPIFLRDPITL